MTVVVHSKAFPVTLGIRKFAKEQVEKLGKFSQKGIENVSVFLDGVKNSSGQVIASSAKVVISVPGKDVVVSSKAHDAYLAISKGMKVAVRRLRKRRGKRLRRR